MKKGHAYCMIEGGCYAAVALGTPWIVYLESDRPISWRLLCAVAVASIVGAANAIKAFLSQSMSDRPSPP